MSNVIIAVIVIVGALGIGGFASWFYFVKVKRPKAADAASDEVAASKENDEDREKIKQEIKEQIKKNEEIRERMKDRLGE